MTGSFGLFAPKRAWAHASAISTEPATGSQVATSPPRVVVRFNSAVEFAIGGIRVINSAEETVSGVGIPYHPDGQSTAVAADLPPLADGPYIVAFQVISADGHQVKGAFSFSIGTAAVAPSAELLDRLATGGDTTNRGLTLLGSVGRLLVFVGAIIGSGALAFILMQWRAGATVPWLGRVIVVVCVLGTIASFLQIAIVGALALGGGFGSLTDIDGWRTVWRSPVGPWWLARSLAFAALTALAIGRRNVGTRWWRRVLLAVVLVLFVAMAKGGHSASGRWRLVGQVSTVAHLAALAIWLGGLVALFAAYVSSRSGRSDLNDGDLNDGDVSDENSVVSADDAELPSLGRDLAHRFSNVALASVGVVVVTGVVQTRRQIFARADFSETAYGRALTTKLVVFVVLIGVAAATRWLHNRPKEASVLRTHDMIGLEIAFAAGILGLTASIVNLPPPQAQPPQPFSSSIIVGRREASVIIEPAAVGQNTVHLTVLDSDALAKTADFRNPTSLTLRFSLEAKDVPPIKVLPTAFLANHATFEGVVLPVKGTWQLDVVATYGSEQVLFTLPVKIV